MPKVEIHLEITVPSEPLNVNQIIALFQEIETQVRPALVAGYLEASQDLVLDEVLGPKWEDKAEEETPWSCPQCQSRLGFKRRGSRSRTLRKSSLGRVPFQLRQVTCSCCESTFSPLPDWFGLEPYQVSTTEFQANAVEVACQTSYARSASLVRALPRPRPAHRRRCRRAGPRHGTKPDLTTLGAQSQSTNLPTRQSTSLLNTCRTRRVIGVEEKTESIDCCWEAQSWQ